MLTRLAPFGSSGRETQGRNGAMLRITIPTAATARPSLLARGATLVVVAGCWLVMVELLSIDRSETIYPNFISINHLVSPAAPPSRRTPAGTRARTRRPPD